MSSFLANVCNFEIMVYRDFVVIQDFPSRIWKEVERSMKNMAFDTVVQTSEHTPQSSMGYKTTLRVLVLEGHVAH